jgi:hypothetical protein
MPTTKKNQKMCWFGKLCHFKRLVKIMLFAKSYGWIHDLSASMALPLGPKNNDEIFFWTPKKELKS